jgi:hypothetical protein
LLNYHHDKCKPALFQQVDSIIARYKQVEAKLNLLFDARKPLRRLKWWHNAPQAKGLMKKVETIKTSLCLVVGLIRLAHEQSQPQ